MLGTDPTAERNRREPVRGDVRLLVTEVGGRTKAVLFRAVAPDAAKGRDLLYQSPIGQVHFDEVADVSDSVALAGHDGDFEFSVPLVVLGLHPERGAEVLGDLGLLQGDGRRRPGGSTGTTSTPGSSATSRARPGSGPRIGASGSSAEATAVEERHINS